jgi:hypothetical protein
VREYRLDWLKFDQPMVAACRSPSHGHDSSVRGSLQANNQAFYDILADLRQEFPELFVESTFDGAGYLDYGVFARSHAAWLDDASGDPTVPMQTVQQSFYGASLAFPVRFLTLWLARAPVGDGVAGRGLTPDDLRYQAYSTMGGSWGVSLRLTDLDDAQRQTVQELIEEYQAFRDLLPGARVYHLLPALNGVSAGLGSAATPGPVNGPAVTDWLALQYLQPDTLRAAALVVRNGGGPERQVVRLQGLVPHRPYRVEWSDGRVVAEELGQSLMETGVGLDLPPLSGGILSVTAV